MARNSYIQLGLSARTLEYHLKGLEVREKLVNPQYISASLRSIGATYELIGENNQAIKYFQEALVLVETGEPNVTLARAFDRITSVYT